MIASILYRTDNDPKARVHEDISNVVNYSRAEWGIVLNTSTGDVSVPWRNVYRVTIRE